MHINFLSQIVERIKFKVSDSLSANKLIYIIYFLFIVLGGVFGVISGKDIPKLYDVNIDNRITIILYENGGIFSVFFSDLIKFFIIYVICIIGIYAFPLAMTLIPICCFIAFKGIRNAICLIVIGGIENILCAILFHIIYYLIFLILVSYVVVKTISYSKLIKGCKFNLITSFRCITPAYVLILAIMFAYSTIISFLVSIFAI